MKEPKKDLFLDAARVEPKEPEPEKEPETTTSQFTSAASEAYRKLVAAHGYDTVVEVYDTVEGEIPAPINIEFVRLLESKILADEKGDPEPQEEPPVEEAPVVAEEGEDGGKDAETDASVPPTVVSGKRFGVEGGSNVIASGTVEVDVEAAFALVSNATSLRKWIVEKDQEIDDLKADLSALKKRREELVQELLGLFREVPLFDRPAEPEVESEPEEEVVELGSATEEDAGDDSNVVHPEPEFHQSKVRNRFGELVEEFGGEEAYAAFRAVVPFGSKGKAKDVDKIRKRLMTFRTVEKEEEIARGTPTETEE